MTIFIATEQIFSTGKISKYSDKFIFSTYVYGGSVHLASLWNSYYQQEHYYMLRI